MKPQRGPCVWEMRCSRGACTRTKADCGSVAGFCKSPSPLPTPRRARGTDHQAISSPSLLARKGLLGRPLQAAVSPGRAARDGTSGESASLTGVRAEEEPEGPSALGSRHSARCPLGDRLTLVENTGAAGETDTAE